MIAPDVSRSHGRLIALLFVLVGGLFYVVYKGRRVAPSSPATQAATLGLPVMMPTSGGRLEIATITANERFVRPDPKFFYGLSLGTTVSEMEARATYRYYITLEKKWPLAIQGKTCVVRAGEVKPTLPVAFDTSTLRKRTENGWARFNKEENLSQLEKSLTDNLGQRAEAYVKEATQVGRQVVAEFVMTWLLKEQGWQRHPDYRVVVLFPGES